MDCSARLPGANGPVGGVARSRDLEISRASIASGSRTHRPQDMPRRTAESPHERAEDALAGSGPGPPTPRPANPALLVAGGFVAFGLAAVGLVAFGLDRGQGVGQPRDLIDPGGDLDGGVRPAPCPAARPGPPGTRPGTPRSRPRTPDRSPAARSRAPRRGTGRRSPECPWPASPRRSDRTQPASPGDRSLPGPISNGLVIASTRCSGDRSLSRARPSSVLGVPYPGP